MPKRGHIGTSMGGTVIHTRRRRKRRNYTEAGEVTVKHPDGTVEVTPAYTPRKHAKVVR